MYLTDWSDLGECHDHDGVHRTSGRIYKITYGTPKALPKDLDLAARTNDQLVELVNSHSNHWHVRRARRLLQERAARGDDVSDALDGIASKKSQDRLWTASATGTLERETLFTALTDPNENIRALSIRLLTDEQPAPSDAARRLADGVAAEKSAFVRLAYASAMQRLEGEPRWQIAEALAKHGEDADDHNLPLMIWYGLEPLVPFNIDRSIEIAKTTPIPLLRRHIARRVASLGNEQPQSLAKLMDLLAEVQDASKRGDVLDWDRRGVARRPPRRAADRAGMRCEMSLLDRRTNLLPRRRRNSPSCSAMVARWIRSSRSLPTWMPIRTLAAMRWRCSFDRGRRTSRSF